MENNKLQNENEEMAYYQDPGVRGKIDKLLAGITAAESEMGTDSTPEDKEDFVKWKQEKYLEIKEIDPIFYNRIKPSKDQ